MNLEKVYDKPYEDTDVGLKKFMTGVYSWMTIGILLTAVISLLMVKTGAVSVLIRNQALFFVLLLAEVLLVGIFAVQVWRLPQKVATAIYLCYSALNGVTLSSIFLIYAKSSIASTFFITAAMFGVFSFYGMIAKGDLTRWSRPLMMCLLGLIIAGVVNFFLKSSPLQWLISVGGVVLFSMLTIYDTFKLKKQYLSYDAQIAVDENFAKKAAIFGALTLYLDFINLFMYLLRLFGGKKD